MELEEELVTCNQVEDVCFGRVVLTVSNKTDTASSQGYIQVPSNVSGAREPGTNIDMFRSLKVVE